MTKFTKIITSTLIIYFLLSTSLYPQKSDLIFQNLSTADGLPSDKVQEIFQDHLGFLWFGTGNGLVQYDGYKFKVYQQDDNDPFSISGNNISQISEDLNGNLWVLTKKSGEINKFDRKTGEFVHFFSNLEDSTSTEQKDVLQFYLDSAGDLWTVTFSGKLDKINTETGIVSHYRHDLNDSTSLSYDNVFAMSVGHLVHSALYEDSKGRMWIGTENGGLNQYVRETDSFISYKHDPDNPFSISFDTVSNIFEDSQENLWISTWGGGLNRYSPRTNTFTRYRHKAGDPKSIGSDFCYKILEDKSNNLWIALGNGLDRFDKKKEVFTHHYRHDPGDPNSLNRGNRFLPIYEEKTGFVWILVQGRYNRIDRYEPRSGQSFSNKEDYNNLKTIIGHRFLSFFEDHSGVLWLGTGSRGVTKYDPLIQSFRNYKHEPGEINSLNHNRVDAIIESKSQPGVLWIGTPKGLNKYDTQTNTFTHYRHDPNNSNSLSNNHVLSLVEDETGLLWIGTKPGGFNSYNVRSGRFKHYDYSPEYSKKWAIYHLVQGRSGITWLTEVQRGLIRFDNKNKTFTRYGPYPERMNYPINSVSYIYEDREESLWIGTFEGLRKFDKQRHIFTPILQKASILQIYEDSNNNLWLTTKQSGLALFDRETGEAIFYNHNDGLASNFTRAVVEDNYGNLWVATAGGLSRFSPQTGSFTNFYIQHGLPSYKFQQGGIRTRDGQIWLGTLDNGIVAFNPDEIKINSTPPKMALTDIKLFNKSLTVGQDSPLKQHISVAKKNHLAHWQNDISLECTAIHFSNSQKNQYAFWLENYDEDWRYMGTNRVASYTNLDPGEYVFHAKGANSDNVWDEEGVSLRIVIHPPWWRTSLAYVFYILFFISVLYSARRFDVNRAKLKNELKMKAFEAQKLQEVDRMKSRFFANISHEFRTPLTLILGPVEKWLSKTTQPEMKQEMQMMQRNGHRLLRLINQLLDLSKLEANKLSLETKHQNVIQLLKAMIQSFSSLAETKRITLSFDAPDEDIFAFIDRDKFEKIINNLLSNALKFTPDSGQVKVGIELGAPKKQNDDHLDFFDISVSDSGLGIAADRLDKIFDRFYQVDDSLERKHEGTGIGLALTKELVELHHGEITVSSVQGEGATFTIRLPLGREHLKDNEVLEETTATPANDSVHLQTTDEILEEEIHIWGTVETENDIKRETRDSLNPHVLIVEDSVDVRQYVRSYLENDYQVAEAANGSDGLEYSIECQPDLIISDVMMPKMDGFKLCEALKTDERTSHIPIILLTARASGESKVEGLETGADDYLTKPFDAKELQVRVKNLIDQRQKLREKFSREISLQPRDIAVTSTDEKFLQRVMEIVEEHISDSDFTVEKFTRCVGMSHMQLHRKLKALTEKSANDFIRTMRLKRAAHLLRQKTGNVTEVAYSVGFNNPSYFAECFRKQFLLLPSEYASHQPESKPESTKIP